MRGWVEQEKWFCPRFYANLTTLVSVRLFVCVCFYGLAQLHMGARAWARLCRRAGARLACYWYWYWNWYWYWYCIHGLFAARPPIPLLLLARPCSSSTSSSLRNWTSPGARRCWAATRVSASCKATCGCQTSCSMPWNARQRRTAGTAPRQHAAHVGAALRQHAAKSSSSSSSSFSSIINQSIISHQSSAAASIRSITRARIQGTCRSS